MNTKINERIFEEFPVLESDRLLFREFEINDAQDLFLIRSDDRVMRFMDSFRHKTIQDSEDLVSSVRTSFSEKSGLNWVIIERSTNEFIGYFGFWRLIPEHCRAEIGYALKPKYWGRGFMKEAMTRLLNFGFTDLQVHSVEANVNPENMNSIHLLEKLGFQKEAYFRENYLFEGQFIDSLIYSMLETDER